MCRTLLAHMLLAAAVCQAVRADTARYHVGRPATAEDIRAAGISVAADGSGLPAGSGTALQGRPLYNAVLFRDAKTFTHRAAHSCEIRPQTGQLSLPSRSVATSSGGQQRGHRLNPNSPPSVAWAIRRSFSASQRTFPSRAGASPVAERISRAARTFSETTVIERSAECRASMSMLID